MSKNTTPAAETLFAAQPSRGGSFRRGADGKLERIEATASASPAEPQDDADADEAGSDTAEQKPSQKNTGNQNTGNQSTGKKDNGK